MVEGSVVFAILFGTLMLIAGCARGSGLLDKDNSNIASVVITISVLCMWMFWMCATLHQWHPLIAPIYEEME